MRIINHTVSLPVVAVCFCLATASAQVPQLLHYQGRIAVDGVNFEGAGQFKFALVDAGTVVTPETRQATAFATISDGLITRVTMVDVGTGYTKIPRVEILSKSGIGGVLRAVLAHGTVDSIAVLNPGEGYIEGDEVVIGAPNATPYTVYQTYWSNDGTGSDGGQPAVAVELSVTKGLYDVLLGDPSLANMTALPADALAHADVRLRVWFSNGTLGFQQLTPDQRLVATAYALLARSVPDGTITGGMIADGAVGSVDLATGAVGTNQLSANAVTAAKLAAGAVGSSQLATGAVSAGNIAAGAVGEAQLAASSVTAAKLATGAVGTTQLAASAVTSAKLATGAVVSNNLAASAVTTAKLATGAVGSSQIATGAVGSSQLAANLTIAGTMTASSFSGSGTGLSGVPGSLPWQTVSGASQQAVSNRGYLTTNSARVTVTLPAAPTQGDTVRVSAAGAGGWLLAQNSGQQIISANLGDVLGRVWNSEYLVFDWFGLAMSDDGNTIAAAAWRDKICVSTDGGSSWTQCESNREWHGIACSADGTKLAACVNGGQIYTSTDTGASWIARDSSRAWDEITSSSDGAKLAACVNGGQIYTSTNSGATWIARGSNRSWSGITSSDDGTKLAACVNGGQIYTSVDSGVTWTARDSNRGWYKIASSADGNRLAASADQVYTSTDGGVTWMARPNSPNVGNIACSADGHKLMVAGSGRIYTSTDGGGEWFPTGESKSWGSVAMSANGSRLVAGVANGYIYLSFATTTADIGGYITGEQGSAIELQYVGNGTWQPLSFLGPLTFY